MKIKFSLICILIISAFFLSNCKKGPEDPTISLLTRKARLAGKWMMQSGTASITSLSSTAPPFNQNLSFNGTKVELNQTETSGPAIIYTGAYTLILEIQKEGTFNFSENFAGDILEAKGRWHFEYGSGDLKNKEEVTFIVEETTKGETLDHVFNKQRTVFTYKLIQLKNKDLKIESFVKTYINSNGDRITYTNQYKFAQPL